MKLTHLAPVLHRSAGTQPQRRVALVLGLVAVLTLLVGSVLVERAAVSPHAVAAGHTCHATQVTLHGTKAAPTIRCLDGTKGTVRTLHLGGSGPLAHMVQVWSCSDDALVLYWNYISDVNNSVLCINGTGTFDLSPVGWSNQVTGWWTGCYSDYFYTGHNGTGPFAWEPGSYDGEYSPWGNFPQGSVGNDQLESVVQSYQYGGDDCPSRT